MQHFTLFHTVFCLPKCVCPHVVVHKVLNMASRHGGSYWEQGGGQGADIGNASGASVISGSSSFGSGGPMRPPSRSGSAARLRASAGAVSGERIKLAANATEQARWDDLADMYALLVSADRLEKLWRRDAVDDTSYTTQCRRLLQKFEALRGPVGDLDAFYAEYNVNAAGGKYRLADAGVPGTVENCRPDAEEQGRHNIYCVQKFISLLDNVELGQRAPEDLLNVCASLERSLDRVQGLPSDFEFRNQLRTWIAKLNAMAPTEELNDNDAARFKMDVSAGYNEYLHHKKAL